MEPQVLGHPELLAFLAALGRERELVGPVARAGGQHVFAAVADPGELDLRYVHTILPPKKYLLPPREVLLAYDRSGPAGASAEGAATPRVIVGVHPCDLAGIRHLDLTFSHEPADPAYRARRAATVLIGVDCLPDAFCFCGSVGTARPRGGFDLFLLELDGGWLVTVGTERGKELLSRHAQGLRPAGSRELSLREDHYREKERRQTARLHAAASDLPLLFEGAWRDPVWERTADRCLGCGTCTNVCPTCYCFDVRDEVGMDLERGTRTRVWDSCQLWAFTEVAGGEVFREKLALRVRHRVYRKFHYLHSRFNEPNCTGCGRCGRQCTAGIRMDGIVNELIASVVAAR